MQPRPEALATPVPGALATLLPGALPEGLTRPAMTSERTASADSLDGELAALLRRPCTARVHSVFHRVVNLVLDDQRLVALCSDDLDDAPWSVRVAVPDWDAWRIDPGDPARLDAHGIELAAGRIDLTPARIWTVVPPQPWHPGIDHAIALQRHLAAAPRPADPFARAVTGRIAVLTGRLARAEQAQDAEPVRAAVEGLLGLGAGLTPAGDDVLTGILLIAAQPGSRIALTPRAVLAALADDPARTTAVSVATLTEAVWGRARQRVLDLLHDLAAGVPEPRVAPVLAIGHTSGSDLVAGLACGIHLERQLRGTL